MPENTEIENLKRRIRKLESNMGFHKHTGYGSTQMINGNLSLKTLSQLAIGTSGMANDNLSFGIQNEVNRLVLLIGKDVSGTRGYTTENTQLTIEHQPENFLWKGDWVVSTAYKIGDAVRNDSKSWRCYVAHTSHADTEPDSGVDYATKWVELNFYSFYTGVRPPLSSGPSKSDTIGVTAAASTLTDTKQIWGINYLADAYISVTGGTLVLETHKIASNTATEITITDTWTTTDSNIAYVVWRPVYFGAANYPWRRIYLTDDIRFGLGASGGTGTVFISYGPDTPEGALAKNVGSLYLRTNGGANTTLYVKESGSGNTGWAAK